MFRARASHPLQGADFTELTKLYIHTRAAKTDDIGALVNIFIKSFENDQTAQLLYRRDGVWPVAVGMLRSYLVDYYTRVILAWDETSDTIVGWTSVTLVPSDRMHYLQFCDSTVWAGQWWLRKEEESRGGTPLHMDDLRRHSLIFKLRERNRRGQDCHTDGQHLVINTFAIHPDVVADEIPNIAYKLMNETRDLAKRNRLALWAQVPQSSPGKLGELFEEIGFTKVGSFQLNLAIHANEEHWRRRNWGFQKYTQWVLRFGDWDRGRRY